MKIFAILSASFLSTGVAYALVPNYGQYASIHDLSRWDNLTTFLSSRCGGYGWTGETECTPPFGEQYIQDLNVTFWRILARLSLRNTSSGVGGSYFITSWMKANHSDRYYNQCLSYFPPMVCVQRAQLALSYCLLTIYFSDNRHTRTTNYQVFLVLILVTNHHDCTSRIMFAAILADIWAQNPGTTTCLDGWTTTTTTATTKIWVVLFVLLCAEQVSRWFMCPIGARIRSTNEV